MKLTKLRLKNFRGISDEFEVPIGGHSALIFGENGASKSSIALALELLFDTRSDRDLLVHKNIFGADVPSIHADFVGRVENTNPKTQQVFYGRREENLSWEAGQPKPLPSWLLTSAARSAFLDHRKLLLLSDRTRDLSENFFRTAVHHLFTHLDAGTSRKTVGGLWQNVTDLAAVYRQALTGKGREAQSGVSDPVARYKPIEDGLNTLNAALEEYLLPQGGNPPLLATKAQRLLRYFEDLRLTLTLRFESLTFDRASGTIKGGRLHPEVKYCDVELMHEALNELGEDENFPDHHEILNEARLTALALALFFAAVLLQDEIPYLRGNGEPEKPARLLVLDDVLVGLDYDHRIPVLEILRKEFLKAKRFQVLLLTHNREWFDFCRLKVGGSNWNVLEIYAKREGGPKKSDYPVKKEGSSDLLQRAKKFLDDPKQKEIPAAANYARTAIEWALKELCAKYHRPIPFTLEPHRLNTDTFLKALTKYSGGRTRHPKIIGKALQTELEALRKTVLNAYSHWHPTTAVEAEVRKAIAVAEQLVGLLRAKSL